MVRPPGLIAKNPALVTVRGALYATGRRVNANRPASTTCSRLFQSVRRFDPRDPEADLGRAARAHELGSQIQAAAQFKIISRPVSYAEMTERSPCADSSFSRWRPPLPRSGGRARADPFEIMTILPTTGAVLLPGRNRRGRLPRSRIREPYRRNPRTAGAFCGRRRPIERSARRAVHGEAIARKAAVVVSPAFAAECSATMAIVKSGPVAYCSLTRGASGPA